MRKDEKKIIDEINSKINESGDFNKIKEQIVFKDFVKESKQKKSFNKKHFYWITPLAACSLVFVIVLPTFFDKVPPNTTEEATTSVSNDDAGTVTNSSSEVYEDMNSSQTSPVLPWDLKSDIEKYSSIFFQGITYDVFSTLNEPLDIDYIDTLLVEDVSVKGYDIYEEEEHTDLVDVYSIKKIDAQCSIAVYFKTSKLYYSFNNTSYKFNTLGEMIDKLNLKEYLVNTDFVLNQNGVRTTFLNSKEIFWTHIFNDENLRNSSLSNSGNYTNSILSCGVDIVPLGEINISVGLNEKGYIQTNILASAKTFYIGKMKVNEIIDYVKNNYRGEN